MKRIILIGKRGRHKNLAHSHIRKPQKKLASVFGAGFVFYVIFFSMKIITLNDIRVFLNRSAGEIIYMLTVDELEGNYTALAYKNVRINKKSVAQSFIDNINNTISYYGYVKENVKKDYLVVYDPNKVMAKSDDTGSVEDTKGGILETESTITASKNEEIKEEKEDIPVSIGQNGIMKLTGAGSGTVYSLESLNDFDFLLSNFYVVPERASVLSSELNASELLAMDMSIKKDSNVPQILIYHTHSMEGFTDSIEGNFDTNIVSVGRYLSEILSNVYGYNVIHCTESFDYVNGKLDRSQAYTYARTSLEQILADNPTIEVVIDVHRDGVNENLHLVTDVNGKQTSQIMFFNGLSRTSAGGDIDYLYNKYKKQNLAFSLQLKLLAEQYFPGFTRRNYLDAYQYNLDLRERSVLVEVGAQTNSLGEAKNAMEPLAALLDRVLSGDEGI